MKAFLRCAAVALSLLLHADLVAQGTTWHPIVSPTPPIAAAWDSAQQTTVWIARDGEQHHWQWNGIAAERRVTAAPTYSILWLGNDAAAGRLLAIAPPHVGTWDGARWSWQTPVTAPTLGFGVRYAFDEHRRRIVAYDGGTNAVHEWDGSQWWTTTATTGPAVRVGAAFAYDRTSQRCVLYGGGNTTGVLADCWRWDGSTWTVVATNAPPGPRTGAALAFDPGLGSLLLYGGSTATTTWRLIGNVWTQVPTLHDPGPRTNALLVQDPLGMLLVSGTGDPFGTAWRFTGTDWVAVATFAAPVGNNLTAAAIDRVRNQVLLFGGGSLATPSTTLFDTQWRGTMPTQSPAPRNRPMLCWSAANQRVLLFGGIDASSTVLGDTWSWTGTDWTQHTPTQSPPPRVRGLLAEDPSGGVLLLGGFDGTNVLNDHWHWNGTSWAQVTGAVMPPPSSLREGALDPISNRVVVVDYQAVVNSTTWLWDGASWAQQAGNPQMIFSGSSGLAFDPQRGRLIAASFPPYEWTGTSWNQLPQPVSLPGFVIDLLDDRSRQRLLAVTQTLEVAQRTDDPATVTPTGYGCAIGQSPVLHALQDPTVGNGGFALECATVTPSSPALLTFGFGSQNQPLGGGCSLLVALPIATVFLAGTANAQVRFSLPIPNDPGLRGVQLVSQGAVLDPLRSPIGSLTVTASLRIAIGD